MHAVAAAWLHLNPRRGRVSLAALAGPERPYIRENATVTSATDLPEHYRALLAPLRAKCRRVLGDPSAAEDAAQEAFARFLSSGPELRGPSDARQVTAWLYRTCVRVAIDILRDRRRSPLLAASDDVFPCAVDAARALEARSVLRRMRSMPDDEMEAAMLCRIDGLTHIEASEVMGVSERTVRRLLDRFDGRVVDMRKESAP
jgi:RNA polymerase sigma-70 factor (ECF subfamily)